MKAALSLALLSMFTAQAHACPDIVGSWDCLQAGTDKPGAGAHIRKKGKTYLFDAVYFEVPGVPGETLSIPGSDGEITRITTTCTASTLEIAMNDGKSVNGRMTYTLDGNTLTVVPKGSYVRVCKRM